MNETLGTFLFSAFLWCIRIVPARPDDGISVSDTKKTEILLLLAAVCLLKVGLDKFYPEENTGQKRKKKKKKKIKN